jgi:hypothetical protein
LASAGRCRSMDVLVEAHRRGWELEETYRDGRFVFRWVGGDPRAAEVLFSTESEALAWMGQRLADQPSQRAS